MKKKSNFERYLELMSIVDKNGLFAEWNKTKEDEGLKFETPLNLNPRIEQFLIKKGLL